MRGQVESLTKHLGEGDPEPTRMEIGGIAREHQT